MAFQCIFTVEDISFNVISFNYRAMRDYDRTGRPTSMLYGFKIQMELEHKSDCVFLHDWAYKNHDIKSGKITFSKRDNFQKQTEIRFAEGYIVSINTSFANAGERPMSELIEICAGKFEYESEGKFTQYEMNWPV